MFNPRAVVESEQLDPNGVGFGTSFLSPMTSAESRLLSDRFLFLTCKITVQWPIGCSSYFDHLTIKKWSMCSTLYGSAFPAYLLSACRRLNASTLPALPLRSPALAAAQAALLRGGATYRCDRYPSMRCVPTEVEGPFDYV